MADTEGNRPAGICIVYGGYDKRRQEQTLQLNAIIDSPSRPQFQSPQSSGTDSIPEATLDWQRFRLV